MKSISKLLTVAVALTLMSIASTTASAATIHVNSAYAGSGDTNHSVFNTQLTLREAIDLVNGTSIGGLNTFECSQVKNDATGQSATNAISGCALNNDTIGQGNDTIVFDFTTATTIQPVALYAPITKGNVIIDGNSKVTLDGTLIPELPGTYGLKFDQVNGGQVLGLTIQEFDNDGGKGLWLSEVSGFTVGSTSVSTKLNKFFYNTNAVYLEDSEDVTIANNSIGNNEVTAMGNTIGVVLDNTVDTAVGTTTLGNNIGGNGTNVAIINSDFNTVTNNTIGAIPSNLSLSFTGTEIGVAVSSDSDSNIITSNLILGMTVAGVNVQDANSNANTIRMNTIRNLGTAAEGIKLDGTANDNPATPLITSASNTFVIGTLTGAPNGTLVDIYTSESPTESWNLLGTATVTNGTFNLINNAMNPVRRYVTANASYFASAGYYSSSELRSFIVDTDNDDVTDVNEGNLGTDPTDIDSDNDGLTDGQEDSDGDGVINELESSPTDACDPNPTSPACNEETESECTDDSCIILIDEDGDGVATNEELTNRDNCPNIANPEQEDTDHDGYGDACDTPAGSRGTNAGGGGGFSLPPSNGYIPLSARDSVETNSNTPRPTRINTSGSGCAITDIFGHWSYDYVTELCTRGVVQGYGMTKTFAPNNEITRAEFVKILLGAMGIEVEATNARPFNDVAVGEWYTNYIYTAKAYGITEGYNDNTFKPTAKISRSEAVKMILSALGENVSSTQPSSFSDVPAGHWATRWIEKGKEMGIVNGYSLRTFKPDANVLRGEAAKMIAEGVLR